LGRGKKLLTVIPDLDQLGNEAANLIEVEKPKGNYIVNFDASEISSGVYLCRLLLQIFLKQRILS